MKKMFVFVFVVLIVLATANPVSAQGNTPPESDGWKCLHVQGNVAIGSAMSPISDYPIDQVWVDGELFTQDIPDEAKASFMILNLGTNDIRIKKNVGDPMQIVCYHMILPVTATPLPTSTPAMTATPLSTSTAVATKTSVQDQTSVPTLSPTATTIPSGKSLWPIATVIVLIVFGLFLLIHWYTKLHHH